MAVFSAWYLKEIQTRVYRTPFFTHISENLVGTYRDLFEEWGSIPPEYLKMILAIHMDRIDAINGRDRKLPSATW